MKSTTIGAVFLNALLVSAACPYMDGGASLKARSEEKTLPGDDGFLDDFVVDDKDVYMTSDFGTPIDDLLSLKAGARGPTLLEDFILRQKITRFDHERIPERVGMPCFLFDLIIYIYRFARFYTDWPSSCAWCRCTRVL